MARLVEGPLFDPIVYVRVLNTKRAFLFDCGRMEHLTNRELLRLEAIFISHTHMDHFMGLDHVLRAILHRDAPLHVWGPPGMGSALQAKLQAYTWNLTAGYGLEILAHEVSPGAIVTTTFRAEGGFAPAGRSSAARTSLDIAHFPRYSVAAEFLDHTIPCLGFVAYERVHVNILGGELVRLGYLPGDWIGRLKDLIMEGLTEEVLQVPTRGGQEERHVSALRDELCLLTPGQRIAYLTDIRCSPENIQRLYAFAMGVDTLFIEAHYRHALREQAFRRGHLTARQAGVLARLLKARRVVPLHVSPRHHHELPVIERELREGYAGDCRS